VLANDLSGLVSDMVFKNWPEELSIPELLSAAKLGDCKVNRGTHDMVRVSLDDTALWKDRAWRGGSNCRWIKVAVFLVAVFLLFFVNRNKRG
jgi:hypothetical protein